MGLLAQEVYERLEERKDSVGRVLADAYRCRPGCTAVVEMVDVLPDIQPKEAIEDVEMAFQTRYWPRLEKQLEVEADYVPDIDVFHGTVLIAGAMGCEIRYTAGEWPWAMPMLTSIRDVDTLKPPDVRACPIIQRYFDQIRCLQEKTQHRVPIKLMDLQSPLTTAAQMRHYQDILARKLSTSTPI